MRQDFHGIKPAALENLILSTLGKNPSSALKSSLKMDQTDNKQTQHTAAKVFFHFPVPDML